MANMVVVCGLLTVLWLESRSHDLSGAGVTSLSHWSGATEWMLERAQEERGAARRGGGAAEESQKGHLSGTSDMSLSPSHHNIRPGLAQGPRITREFRVLGVDGV